MANFRHAKIFLIGLSTICAAPRTAFAQLNDFGTRQRADLAQPPVPHRPPQRTDDHRHLFGDWGGARTWLLDRGVDIIPAYMMEAAGNTSGGVSQGSAFTGRFGIDFEIDWGKLGGIHGLKSHTLIMSKSGRDLSADRLGHDPYSATELYGRIGTLVKLQFAYLTEDLMKGHLQLAAGRMNQGFFFDTSPVYCMFLSLSICPVPRVLPGANPAGFYTKSRTNWGGYVRYRPVSPVYVQIGAFEVSSNHGGISGFDWSSHGTNGVNFPFEIGWQPGGGLGQRSSHIALGGYYDTAPVGNVYWDRNNQPRALTGGPGLTTRGHTAFWAQIDHMIKRNTRSNIGGLIVFGNFTRSDPGLSAFKQQATIGFEDVGEIRSRPRDGFGVQVTYAWVSNAMRARQALYFARNGHFPPGLYSAQSYEMIIEAQYSYHLYRAVDLQPDFQYIVHPNSQAGLKNAVIFGGRARVNF
ncbi:carbohydrate porin [Acetobacteraceae bacterium EV16G]|uniref:Carbohydrate porin n=1 Tax=Sorlinia euscelidii TaxID=3081148 RepID=A0ABU7U3M5_9PROT